MFSIVLSYLKSLVIMGIYILLGDINVFCEHLHKVISSLGRSSMGICAPVLVLRSMVALGAAMDGEKAN